MKGRRMLGAFMVCAFTFMFFAANMTAKAADNTITVGVDAKTINEAIMKATPGDTVFVPSGVYHEKLIIQNPNIRIIGEEGTVLDGFVPDEDEASKANPRQNDIVPTAEEPAMVDIRADGVDFRCINNIRNYYLDAPDPEKVPKGILAREGTKDVIIFDCKIYDMGCNYQFAREHGIDISDFAANGILVYGNSSKEGQMSGVSIKHCELYNLQLGLGEAISINGNVTGFNVIDNKIHNNDNIGIDAIGYETIVDCISDNEVLKTNDYSEIERDQARIGLVQSNDIYNISSINNPTINKPSAAGIYANGAGSVRIIDNIISYCDTGIEVGCERIAQPAYNLSVRGIEVSENTLYKNDAVAGICFGSRTLDRVGAIGCKFTRNTVYNTNGTCCLTQNAVDSSNIIKENLFLAEENASVYDEVFAEDGSNLLIIDNRSNISVPKEGIGKWDIEEITWDKSDWFKIHILVHDVYQCGSSRTMKIMSPESEAKESADTTVPESLKEGAVENTESAEIGVVEPVKDGKEIKAVESVTGGEEKVALASVEEKETNNVSEAELEDEPKENTDTDNEEIVASVLVEDNKDDEDDTDDEGDENDDRDNGDEDDEDDENDNRDSGDEDDEDNGVAVTGDAPAYDAERGEVVYEDYKVTEAEEEDVYTEADEDYVPILELDMEYDPITEAYVEEVYNEVAEASAKLPGYIEDYAEAVYNEYNADDDKNIRITYVDPLEEILSMFGN